MISPLKPLNESFICRFRNFEQYCKLSVNEAEKGNIFQSKLAHFPINDPRTNLDSKKISAF